MRAAPREHAIAAVALAAVLIVFFWEALGPGRLLGAADLVFTTPAFRTVAPPGFTRPQNELLFDQAYQFIPWRRFAWEALRAGRLPLWNPWSSSGTPFIATMQSAVFYPINLLLTLAPFASTFVLSALLRLWIAGMATYGLARTYGLSLAAGLLAGIAFMLCGFLVVWLQHPHANVAVWLPVLLLLGEHMVTATAPRRRWRFTALLALAIGAAATGGHVETLLHVLLAFAAVSIVRAWQMRPAAEPQWATGMRVVAPLVLGAGLGCGLAAVQLAPFLEWLPLSAELAHRTATGPALLDPGFWRHLCWLPVAIYPELLGNPTAQYPYHAFLPWGNFNEGALYIGTVPLACALVGTAVRWRDTPPVCVWTVVTLVSLGMALHLPGVHALNALPLMRLANPDRLRLVASFGLCILAGFGATALVDAIPGVRRHAARLWTGIAVAIAGLGVAVLAAGWIVLPLVRERVLAFGQELVAARYAALAGPGEPLAAFHQRLEGLVDDMIRAFQPAHVAMYAPALWALTGVLVLARTGTRPGLRSMLLVLLTAADLLAFGRGYHPTVPSADVYPRPLALAAVAKDPAAPRFTALDQTMLPDVQLLYGLADVRGMDFRTRWYDMYLALAPDRVPWIRYGVLLSGVRSPLLRVLNLGWVVASAPDRLTGEAGMTVQPSGGVALGRLTTVWPRAFVVHEAIVAADDAAAAKLLADHPAAVYRRVVLVAEDAPQPLAGGEMTAPATAAPIFRRPERTTWRVQTKTMGYLVITDAYYPGWRAYLDGNPAPIHRANLAFRAVLVPPGTHVVDFRYEPASLELGLWVTLAALLATGALLVSGRNTPGRGAR